VGPGGSKLCSRFDCATGNGQTTEEPRPHNEQGERVQVSPDVVLMSPKRAKNSPATGHDSAYPMAGEWASFLKREPLSIDQAAAAASLRGKRIFLTGAGGWIGSALAAAIARLAPQQLVLLEASEQSLYELDLAMQLLHPAVRYTALLGSVTDSCLLADIFERYCPQIVYHAAAFKHVPLIEQNPFAAMENNVAGTSRVMEAAANHHAEQFILLSTDKAADPVSMMGASKRIAELVLLARNAATTRLKVLRLGNVLGSGGSVLPLFLRQILSGGPVMVTHRDVRRYFLSTEEAVALLLLVTLEHSWEGVFVPELGQPLKVEGLARHLIAERCDASVKPARIVYTQLRPGDKMCETLLSSNESYAGPDDARSLLRPVNSPGLTSAVLDDIMRQLQEACQLRSLPRLLEAVSRAVPEYKPSAFILHESGSARQ
jgi:FlaA1/EpsC-like NDP-sugar epimerase